MDTTQRMDWGKLLSLKRFYETPDKSKKSNKSQFADARSAFEQDYDQLIYCYPFRRLQDKTQVIPFPEFDFVHTRLTHSLEVASIGRSLGKMAAELIPEEIINELKLCKNDIGTLVAAACLAHDIGNPPFGHSGEDSISHYFRDKGLKLLMINGYTWDYFNYDNIVKDEQNTWEQKLQWFGMNDKVDIKRAYDLYTFEGNANGFRILTRSNSKGLYPTYAFLGAFSKYTRESYLFNDPFKNAEIKPVSQKKYGFFQSERDIFQKVANELGLIRKAIDDDIAYCRHPLAFLMEAADDIAYRIIDFEDGCRLGLIDFEKKYDEVSYKKVKIKVDNSPQNILIEIAKIDNSYNEELVNNAKNNKEKFSYLRSKVINVLLNKCFEVFEKNYEYIMCGTFDKSLLESIDDKIIKTNLKSIKVLTAEFVYKYRPVLENEASGFEVVGTLIDSFIESSLICYSCNEMQTLKGEKLVKLLPDEYLDFEEREQGILSFEEKYKRTLRILDYISGMTDNFAISLYRKIKGISLQNTR